MRSIKELIEETAIKIKNKKPKRKISTIEIINNIVVSSTTIISGTSIVNAWSRRIPSTKRIKNGGIKDSFSFPGELLYSRIKVLSLPDLGIIPENNVLLYINDCVLFFFYFFC